MSNYPLLFLDTETGGLDASKYDLLTFGAVLVMPDGTETQYNYGISLPEYRVSEGAMNVNKIDLNSLRDTGLPAHEFLDAVAELLNFRKDTIFIGHNIQFDAKFIQATFERFGRISDYPDIMRNHLDTKAETLNSMRRGLMPKGKTSLQSVCDYFGINTEGHHGAIEDAIMCKNVLKSLDSLN